MFDDEESVQDADSEFLGITDFSPWDGMEVFDPHEAACLLAGISPYIKKSKRSDIAKIADELSTIAFNRQSDDKEQFDNPLLQVLIVDMVNYCSRTGLRSNFLSYRRKLLKASGATEFEVLQRELNDVKSKLAEALLQNKMLQS